MKEKNVELNRQTILVTGAPGFIGTRVVLRLLMETHQSLIISLDNLSDYYDIGLKQYRLNMIQKYAQVSDSNHLFIQGDIADRDLIQSVFGTYKPSVVIHLAAQAGVRYSIDHPDTYIHSNMLGFYNVLEAVRQYPVQHFVYASSSSVYGGNTSVPFRIEDKVDNPVSLYAATKKSNELFAYCYSKLYGIPTTGLRFFTVYGPAGRPDMFYYSATKKLLAGEKLQVFNYGNCKRDFTYIDDIEEGIYRVIQSAPVQKNGDDGLPLPPYAIYNIGGGHPENLMDFIATLADALREANALSDDFLIRDHCDLVPMQPGDVPVTFADCQALETDFEFRPQIDIKTGLGQFVSWYCSYYQL